MWESTANLPPQLPVCLLKAFLLRDSAHSQQQLQMQHLGLSNCANDPGVRFSATSCYLPPSGDLLEAAGWKVSYVCLINTHWPDMLCCFKVPNKVACESVFTIHSQMLFCLSMVVNHSDLWPLTSARYFPTHNCCSLDIFSSWNRSWDVCAWKTPNEIFRLKGSKPQKNWAIKNMWQNLSLKNTPLPTLFFFLIFQTFFV